MENFTPQNNLEINKPKKWVMEITNTQIGVEHPSDYDFEKLPIEVISLDDLVGFEPEDKMLKPESAKIVAEFAEKIKNGTYDLAPILVREYEGKFQIVDGHHRFHAHKIAKSETIEIRIIPPEDIEYQDSRENFS